MKLVENSIVLLSGCNAPGRGEVNGKCLPPVFTPEIGNLSVTVNASTARNGNVCVVVLGGSKVRFQSGRWVAVCEDFDI